MNIRTLAIFTLLILLLTPVALASTTTQSETTPQQTDHSVNETTFLKLWSEDNDTPNSLESINASTDTEGLKQLMRATDWTFTTPPAETIETWNAGDHTDFQPGGIDESVYPSNTNLENSRFLKDAYIRTFSITPSTYTYYTNSNEEHLIGTQGTVRAIIDYRVNVPEGDNTGDRRVNWDLKNQEVSKTELLIDGVQKDSAIGTQTPELSYQDIDSASVLTVETTLNASLEKTVRERKERCTGEGENKTCTTYWETQSQQTKKNVLTLSDNQDVTVEKISATGQQITQGRTNSGSVGYTVRTNEPWRRIEFRDGTAIESNWRFYTASNNEWDTFIRSNGDTTTEFNSSVQPLQLYSFPSDYHVEGTDTDIEIVDRAETNRTAPELPANISVSVANNTYSDMTSIAVEHTAHTTPQTPTVYGLVASTQIQADMSEKSVRETNLTLTNVAVNPGNVTFTAQVTDAETGEPIPNGTITAAEKTTTVNETGHVTMTVHRQPVSVTVAYDAAPWWEQETHMVYTDATTSISMGGEHIEFEFFANLLVATLVWFLPAALLIYALNMITDGAIYDRGDD